MATKPTKTSSVKAKKPSSTSAPKVSRARKSEPTIESSEQLLQSSASPTPAPEAIALRAYERFIARGYQHGQDVEDWLLAEHELRISG